MVRPPPISTRTDPRCPSTTLFRSVTSSTAMGTLATPLFGYSVADKILAIAVMSVWTLNPAGDIEEIHTLIDLEGVHQQLGIETPLSTLDRKSTRLNSSH